VIRACASGPDNAELPATPGVLTRRRPGSCTLPSPLFCAREQGQRARLHQGLAGAVGVQRAHAGRPALSGSGRSKQSSALTSPTMIWLGRISAAPPYLARAAGSRRCPRSAFRVCSGTPSGAGTAARKHVLVKRGRLSEQLAEQLHRVREQVYGVCEDGRRGEQRVASTESCSSWPASCWSRWGRSSGRWKPENPAPPEGVAVLNRL
jgi:hypothetical protein